MAKNFGVSFTIGASLGSSVASAFASVQSKLRATQAAFSMANKQASGLDSVIAARNRLDAAVAGLRAEGGDSKKAAEQVKKLAEAYAKDAQKAGVYGQSIELITRKHWEAEQAMASSQRSINALQTVQRGRDMRADASQSRKTALGNYVADLAPMLAVAKPIQIGLEFDAAMSKVGAISGAVGADFENLRNQARELGASTVWSAKEAAEGMSFLAMAGFKTNEVMAAMPGMLSLASAGGMDLASTADIASNILTGFKKDASEMTNVGNILAKTFTQSNTTIASLGESFKYCAPVAANAGQAFESVAAMIGKLGDAGIQGSMAGTGLNAIIGRMASPPKEAAAAMARLGVKVADASGKMRPMEDVFADIQNKMAKFSEQEQISLAKALYGAEHFAKGFVLQIAAADGSLHTLRDSLKDADGYSDKVAAMQNDNLLGDLRQLNSAAQDLAISFSDSVSPALRKLVGGFTPIVASISQWTQQNPGLVQGLTMLAGAFVALKTAGLAFTLLNSYRRSFAGGLVSLQGQAMRPLAAVRNGFSLLRTELGRPVKLQAEQAKMGLQSLKTKLESLRQAAQKTQAAFGQLSMASLQAGAKAAASGAMAATGRAGFNMLRMGVQGVGAAFKTMFGSMNLLIMGLSYGVDYIISNWDKLAPYFQALWDGVKKIFNSVLGWLEPIIDRITGFISPITDKISALAGWFGEKWNSFWGDDEEKKRKEQAQAEEEKRRQAIADNPLAQKMLELERKNQAAAVKIPAQAAVEPPKKAAVPTAAQARQEQMQAAAPQQAQAPEKAAPQKAPAQAPANKQQPQPQPAQPQIIQPQVQVAVNITQNGIPDQTFATGVMNAIRARQPELEALFSGIVNDQARLAYG